MVYLIDPKGILLSELFGISPEIQLDFGFDPDMVSELSFFLVESLLGFLSCFFSFVFYLENFHHYLIGHYSVSIYYLCAQMVHRPNMNQQKENDGKQNEQNNELHDGDNPEMDAMGSGG